MNRIAAALAAALLLAAGAARAEIERVTIDTPEGKAERWWPRLAVPKGWHHDRASSLNYNMNALAPSGESFSNAEAVMYARAIRQSSDANLRNVEEFMARERASFLKRTPNYEITDGKPLVARDKQKLATRTFAPRDGNGNWERVAYGEEDDYYLVFVASARSKKALDGIAKPFEQMVRQYRSAK